MDCPYNWRGVTDVLLVPGVTFVAPVRAHSSTRTGVLPIVTPSKLTLNFLRSMPWEDGAIMNRAVRAVAAVSATGLGVLTM
jgi:hypothetical protein